MPHHVMLDIIALPAPLFQQNVSLVLSRPLLDKQLVLHVQLVIIAQTLEWILQQHVQHLLEIGIAL